MHIPKTLNMAERSMTRLMAKVIVFAIVVAMLGPSCRLYCEEKSNATKSAAEEIRKGDVLYNQGRLWDSLTHYKEALLIEPGADLYYKVGMIYKNQNMALGEEFFLQAIRLNEEYAPAYKALGEMYLAWGDAGLASEAFCNAQQLFAKGGNLAEAALCKNCEESITHFIAGMNLQNNRNPQQALYHYGLAAEATSFKSPQVLYRMGTAFSECGRFVEAIKEYEKALSLMPEDRDTRYNLALAYKMREDYKKARDLLKEVILVDPQWPYAHKELGRCYMYEAQVYKVKESPEAEAELYEAGVLFLKERNISEADACLEEIKHLCGKSSASYKKLSRKINETVLCRREARTI